MDPNLFPKDFLWGASTASHQVEGGTENQWSEWELANATELAKTAPKRLGWLPNWKSVKAQASDPQNYVSGKGVDHYNRYEEDFDLLEELHLNSFRFSIEWSRVEPKEGAWNLDAIRHYHRYIKSLNKRGIEPILNIWHWTMPTWFTEKGGFEKKTNLTYFDQFVQKIAEEYGNELTYVITLNEPNVYASHGYLFGEWPPEIKNPITCMKVYWNLVQAHRHAYHILKNTNPALQVGVASQLSNMRAYRTTNPIAQFGAISKSYIWNWWFLDRIKRQQDFIGFNYYFTDYYTGLLTGTRNPTTPVSDLGWYMEPDGLFDVLMRISQRYKLPVLITENGLADSKDRYRRWWIEQTILSMQRAMSHGVQIVGYMHWSLLDNFEWKYGWWPKFGLIAVDRANGMKRSVRPSAKWFGAYLGKLAQYQSVRASAHGRKLESRGKVRGKINGTNANSKKV